MFVWGLDVLVWDFFPLEYLAGISRVKSKPEAFQQASKLAQGAQWEHVGRNEEMGVIWLPVPAAVSC